MIRSTPARAGATALTALSALSALIVAAGAAAAESAGGPTPPARPFVAAPTATPTTTPATTPADDTTGGKLPPPSKQPGDGSTTTVAGDASASAPEATTTTVSPAPAGPAPLATIDIGAIGEPPAIGPALDPLVAIANLQMAGMPVAAGSSVAEYSSRVIDNLADDTAQFSRTDTLLMAATSATAPDTILADFQATVETIGAYDVTESTASSEGVHQVGFRATSTDYDAHLPDYTVTVSTYDEAPGLVGVEVQRSNYYEEGEPPPPPDVAAEQFAEPTAVGAEEGWTIKGWSYLDGFNQFTDGTRTSTLSLDFAAGAGEEADTAKLANDLVTRFGEPSYRSDDTDFVYLSYDQATWTVSWSEFSDGNELSVNWQQIT